MRILVTGAAGHLGMILVSRLESDGHEVLSLDLDPALGANYRSIDITDGLSMAAIFRVFKPDAVYHLAGRVGRLVADISPGATMNINVEGARVVATLSRVTGSCLIHVSTSEVYGPDVEEIETAVCRPANWYGRTKLMGEEVVEFERSLGLKATIIRPFMLYTEHERPGAHRSAMIRFASSILAGEPITVHRGTARGWLHMSDAVDFMARLLGVADPPGVLNIGHPDQRSIRELAELIAETLGMEAAIHETDLPPRMTAVKKPSLVRQDALGFVPAVSLEEGVSRVCAARRAAC